MRLASANSMRVFAFVAKRSRGNVCKGRDSY